MAKYKTEFKIKVVKEYLVKVVKEYLEGNIGYKGLAKKYSISQIIRLLELGLMLMNFEVMKD
ncbi:MAG: hypothetical protein E6Y10_03730 [Anaerococcus sp.]|nr:hypothetical protein [Anaerococcus sp.]